GQATLRTGRVAKGVRGAAVADVRIRERTLRGAVQRPGSKPDDATLSAGRDVVEPRRPRRHERPALEPASRHAVAYRIPRGLYQRVRRRRHGRQSARVDERSPRDVSGRLLPRHAPERRRLLVPHRRSRRDVSRLLDGIPLLRGPEGLGVAAPTDRAPVFVELGALARLAVPIAIAQLGILAMSLVDTAAIGRMSVVDLAGAGIGRSIGFGTVVIGIGLAGGLDPLAAQAIGAGDPGRAWQAFVTTLR